MIVMLAMCLTGAPTAFASPARTGLLCNGKWRIATSELVRQFISFSGVAGVTPSLAWAVGERRLGPHGIRPVIERWDGTTWTVVRSAKVGKLTQVFGVAAADVTHAWAVGAANAGLHWKPYVEQFDGVSWSAAPVQSPGPRDSSLFGTVAISDDDAWSVGSRTRRTQGRSEALVERWNGTEWRIVRTPRVPHSDDTVLRSVSAVNSGDAWAVGSAEQDVVRGSRPLVEHWDGASWTIVPTPELDATSEFVSVVARASNDVWAVGDLRDQESPLAEHWDGSRWNVVKVRHAGRTASLRGVTATSANVYAVGFHQGLNPLVERWDGKSFVRVQMPRSGRQHADSLVSVDTDGETVWGVGARNGQRAHPLVDYVC
jgi:hypothetical protein